MSSDLWNDLAERRARVQARLRVFFEETQQAHARAQQRLRVAGGVHEKALLEQLEALDYDTLQQADLVAFAYGPVLSGAELRALWLDLGGAP